MGTLPPAASRSTGRGRRGDRAGAKLEAVRGVKRGGNEFPGQRGWSFLVIGHGGSGAGSALASTTKKPAARSSSGNIRPRRFRSVAGTHRRHRRGQGLVIIGPGCSGRVPSWTGDPMTAQSPPAGPLRGKSQPTGGEVSAPFACELRAFSRAVRRSRCPWPGRLATGPGPGGAWRYFLVEVDAEGGVERSRRTSSGAIAVPREAGTPSPCRRSRR